MAYTSIDDPTLYFNTKLYTGNGSTQSITGVGFQPDWSWIKRRDGSAFHVVTDSVRGATKQIYPNDSQAEGTRAQGLQSFDSDGYTLGNEGDTNASSSTYVAWNWLASNTTASNTDGSITSTVSANTTSGFSIVSYTGNGSAGATIGHGLGSAPLMLIVKRRNTTEGWQVFHTSLGNTKYIELNSTSASVTASTLWNNTSPSSSVVTFGTSTRVNASGSTYIAYCFAEKKGYSKFGSYTGNGNGNADGTFVYTGMKSSFIMLKETSGTSDWSIYDNKREPFNLADSTLEANTSDAEAVVSGRPIDILSNGFKLRGDSSYTNESGATYIYMAFSEAPFVNSNGVPTNAR